MSDSYLRSPIIKDLVFPNLENEPTVSSGSGGDGEYKTPEISEVIFPTLKIAREVISNTLDTRSKQILGAYTFGQMGAIAIGVYEAGISGDIRITPDGLVARNSAGEETIAVDGQTGDLVLKGTILAGSVIAAEINATQIIGQIVNAQIANLDYAKIINVAVTSAQIVSLSADKITAGTINASVINVTQLNASNLASGNVPTARMTTNFLAAAQASVSSLSAITANIGTITAGSITGVTVASSAGTNKIILDSGDYLRFYVGGTLRASMRGVTASRATGIVLDGDIVINNNKSFMIKSSSGSESQYGGLSITNLNQLWITLGSADQFFIKNNAQNVNLFTVSNNGTFSEKPLSVNGALVCKELFLNYGQSEGNIRNVNEISGYNDLQLRTTGGGKVIIRDANLDMADHNVDAAWDVWAYNFNNRSDIRLKKNIKQLQSVIPLVLSLNPSSYQLRAANDKGNKRSHFGLIAQELQEILPELVNEDDSGLLNINYIELIPLLIKSIQELYQLINERKTN